MRMSIQTMAILDFPGARNLLNPTKFRCPLQHCVLVKRGQITLCNHSNLRRVTDHLRSHENRAGDVALCKALRK